MNDAFKKGYSLGFEEGGTGKEIDAFDLSQHQDQHRVGYVLGFGESEFVSAPPDFRYHLIGEMAAKSGVGISLFERNHDLGVEEWEDFKKGYLGHEEDDETFDEDDEFDD